MSYGLEENSHINTSRSEEHTSELQSQSNLVCRLLLEKKKNEEIINSSAIALGRRTQQPYAETITGYGRKKQYPRFPRITPARTVSKVHQEWVVRCNHS